jgi:hypothetical protein
MMNVCFDALKYSKKLQACGFTQQQAEGSAEAWADALTGNVATQQDIMAVKQDIAEVRSELKQDIAELRVATQQDIMALKIEIYKIVGTAVAFLTTVIGIASGVIIHFIK